MVLNELESGLSHHSLISDEDTKKRYRELLAVVKEEYEDIIKGEVQRAISADEDAIRACAPTTSRTSAPTRRRNASRTSTPASDDEPDERLMRAIEEKIDIPDSRKDDFRQEIMNYIGALALDGKKFEYNTNARLYRALELKLFEDQRDTIKLKNLVSQRRRRRDPAEDRRRQAAPHQAVRLQRGQRDRRAQLRREHLRPGRQQEPVSGLGAMGSSVVTRAASDGLWRTRRRSLARPRAFAKFLRERG
jgi:predicted Ser/Thr protein kinase